MKLSIYSTLSIGSIEENEVLVVIEGKSNNACEECADKMGYMYSSDFGATYHDMEENETEETEYVDA